VLGEEELLVVLVLVLVLVLLLQPAQRCAE